MLILQMPITPDHLFEAKYNYYDLH